MKIVNLGGDADTTGAIYGQIAGAYYGDSIPQNWRDKIFFRELILAMAGEITKLSSQVTSEKETVRQTCRARNIGQCGSHSFKWKRCITACSSGYSRGLARTRVYVSLDKYWLVLTVSVRASVIQVNKRYFTVNRF